MQARRVQSCHASHRFISRRFLPSLLCLIGALDSRDWLVPTLTDAAKLGTASGANVSINVYITGEDSTVTPADVEKNKEVDVESIVSQRPMSDPSTEFNEHIGRPDLRAIVEKACASELGGRIAFAGMSTTVDCLPTIPC